MNKKDKLKEEIRTRDGKKCHYCRIEEEEKDFIRIWKGYFYPKKFPYKFGKGRWKLEIDHKDNKNKENSLENCVLACPICNNAKSDKFTYEEFKRVGEVINQIWKERVGPEKE